MVVAPNAIGTVPWFVVRKIPTAFPALELEWSPCIPIHHNDGASSIILSATTEEGVHIVIAGREFGNPAIEFTMLVQIGLAAKRNFDGAGIIIVSTASNEVIDIVLALGETS